MICRLFVFVAAMMVSFNSYAQTWKDTVSLIEKKLSVYQAQNPGCQLSISRNGIVIFSRAWGMADLEHHIPLTTQSVIEAGSVSKQFTAAAILLLAQQKRISMNDDLRKYIPELPAYASLITLRQMMHHTSGLRDWGAIAELSGWPRTTKTYSNADALEILKRQQGLNNNPGDEFLYSNSNYNLFAIIVKRVTGISLADFTKKNLFIPDGMTHTQWRDDYKRIVPNRAIAYKKTQYYYETDMPNEDAYGNGGLLTTTEDLLKWNAFYLSGKFGKPPLLPQQIATEPLNNGLINDYAAGLFIHNLNGLEYIEHSGATAGYRALLEAFPQQRISIAFLSNTSQFQPRIENIQSIKNIFVKIPKIPAHAIGNAAHIPDEKLKMFDGWYRNDRSGEGLNVKYRNQQLYINEKSLISLKENLFGMGNSLLAFDVQGELTVISAAKDSIHYVKVSPAHADPEIKSQYPGKFFSDDTNSSISIILSNGNLLLHLRPGLEFPMNATYEDGFDIKDLGSLYFERNEDGVIIGLKISVPRARKVGFRKID